MAPKRLGWRSAIHVPSILLPLVLLIAAAGGSIPRVYLPMIFVPANNVPSFSHVFIIIMENLEYDQIIGDPAAPYFNSLAQQYGLATSYYAIRHPSLPNYIALTSGDTYSITNDCTNCFRDVPNIADQIEGVGKSWRAYMEGMPSPCFVGDQGRYRQRHNPFIYYDNIRLNPTRCNKIVPFTQFAQDLATDMVPNYVWITPDMCNDLHDCSLDVGDAWLQTWVPQILASPAWQQNGVLFIIFDEGNTRAGCCTNAAGGQIATIVISPLGVPSYRSATAYTHYSLLRTIEDAWDMPHLANAGCDCAAPMSDFFTAAVQLTGR
ncbi:MAG TPA: alkaline phosphatase family protein [Roseiflexaceae bacterium]